MAPPAVPVVPAVEPGDPEALGVAFARMNDALFPDPDVERDGGVPAVAPPVVPVALASPRSRHPTTVIVPLWPARGAVCGELGGVWVGGSWAATKAAQPNAIASSAPARLISASLFLVSTRGMVQATGPLPALRAS